MLVSPLGVEAVLLEANPLSRAGFALPINFAAPAAAVRSGRLEPEGEDELDRVDAARRTWSGEGRREFDAVWDSLNQDARGRGATLWLHPRAGDVIGDVPALKGLAGLGVLLEPAALLTEGMLDDAEDHLGRVLDAVEASGVARVVLVTNLGGDGERTPVERGRIDPGVLLGVIERASAWAPVCVLERDAAGFGATGGRPAALP